MAKKTVYVLTNTELGWDCVCGVFSTKKKLLEYVNEDSEEKIKEEDLNEHSYVMHTETLEL